MTLDNEIKKLLDAEDTTELFATLLGYLVINHERLNFIILNSIETLDKKLNRWKTLAEERSFYDEANEKIVFPDIKINYPVQSFFKKLPDAELRELFSDCILSFCELQKVLAELPEWFEQFHTILERCIKDENQIRNEMVHSTFSFQISNEVHNSMTRQRRVRNATKRKGQIEVTNIDRYALVEFLSYQKSLQIFLEETFWDPDTDFMLDFSQIYFYPERFPGTCVEYAKSCALYEIDFQNKEQIKELVKFMEEEGYSDKRDVVLQHFHNLTTDLIQLDEMRQNLKIKSKDVKYHSTNF